MNTILSTDSYKIGGHWNMLPEGTEVVYSYFESRNGAEYDYTLFFGLQKLLKDLSDNPITQRMVDEANEICKLHFGDENYFNYKGWSRIVEKYRGKLPIRIKAVKEGTKVPTGNVLMTVENVDEEFPWLTNFMESYLTHIWYPCTVATRSSYIRDTIGFNLKTSNDLDEEIQDGILDFLLHDFGYRAVTSDDQAGIGGLAHLVSFKGTDTIPALQYGREYYNCDMAGFSVAATEHSIATARGEEGEKEYIEDLLKKYPSGILSLVADSYNIGRFVDVYIREFKDEIINRWSNGKAPINKLVIRPDSPRFKGDRPEDQVVWILEKLWDIFGGTYNSKGFKVIHPCVGVIYGDGLNEKDIERIYSLAVRNKFDVSPIVCGQGGGLLQKLDRDTQKFAFKCSARKENGIWHDVFKNPLDKTKVSKRGRLALIREDNEFKTIREEDLGVRTNYLKTVFEYGYLLNYQTFEQVRENARKY